jgi:hypothetical protein
MSGTTQQLKNDIDTGKTGDKINEGFDPGAAPLGTDDEASGSAPTPREVEVARMLERGDAAAQPAGQSQRNPERGFPAVLLIASGLLVLILAVLVALAVR